MSTAAETYTDTTDKGTNEEAIESNAATQEVPTDLPPAAAAAVMPNSSEQEIHQEQEAPPSASPTMDSRQRKPRRRPMNQDQTATLQREALETAKRPPCDSGSFHSDDGEATQHTLTNSMVDRENQYLDTLLQQHPSARDAFARAPTIASSEKQESDFMSSDKRNMLNVPTNQPTSTKGGDFSVSQTRRRPGAQMVPGRALGIRPSYMERIQQRQQLATGANNDSNQELLPPPEEVLLEATLVSESTPPNCETTSRDIEATGTTSGKTNNSVDIPVMDTTTNTSTHSIIPIEVEPTVITTASRVNPKRVYTMIGLVVFVLAGALATVLGVLLTNQEDNQSHVPELTEVLAHVPETICYEWTPGEGRSDECGAFESAEQGGGVGNLVALAFWDRHPTVDIVIQNAGAIRADILAGNFTGLDAHLVLPFKNLLYSVEMTGSQLHLALEQGLEYVFSDPGDNHTGAYPYAAGLRFAVDMSQDMGSRVNNLLVQDRELGTWSDIKLDQSYTVLANNFLLSGGDNYTVFASITESTLLAEDATVVFILFAEDKGILVAPELDEYSTISYTPP
eukprot:Nitzschia sp. Nitz4//scaffold7_size249615//171652//173352//NITZ4_001193-RA/size249615-processed-gene-0.151-mRNA-1//1//CDS//3329558490//6178//frame0